MIVEIPILNANSVDPDQTPRFTLFANVPGTLGTNGLRKIKLGILCEPSATHKPCFP